MSIRTAPGTRKTVDTLQIFVFKKELGNLALNGDSPIYVKTLVSEKLQNFIENIENKQVCNLAKIESFTYHGEIRYGKTENLLKVFSSTVGLTETTNISKLFPKAIRKRAEAHSPLELVLVFKIHKAA